ncbi:MAG: pyrroloquinoline quinone biosynthesis protein PqqE [Alphaproteobacteria bacterium]|nr:pyrroloquinoline quinone biosynthesis protein PqqE [Alphaproteobacteria bacterium]
MSLPSPIGLLAELTHRCPLGCPYCSNPIDLVRASGELDARAWTRVMQEAADLGAMHVHLSGGEPLTRNDLAEIVNAANVAGLYTNLITSAIGLTPQRLTELKAAGLDHVQISIQGADPARADAVAHFKGAMKTKREAARHVVEEGLALTINAVVHRDNIRDLPQIIDLAQEWGAGRLEVAHVQYHGWALANRAGLMPSRDEFQTAAQVVEEARERLSGDLVIDHVIPDYYGERPKACMGGWGRQVIVVAPDGRALPCHAAASLPGLTFANVKNKSLSEIWKDDAAFQRYRGTSWMPKPCQGCERAEVDWGGCRCQAFALAGDASLTDPVCALSPNHATVAAAIAKDTAAPRAPYRFRRIGG